MIERFAAGDRDVPFPDVGEAMDWTYVDDAAEVLLRAVDCGLAGSIAWNVVGDRRPIRDAAAHLEARFPSARAIAVPASTPPSGWACAMTPPGSVWFPA